jgi:hypothetical protein
VLQLRQTIATPSRYTFNNSIPRSFEPRLRLYFLS